MIAQVPSQVEELAPYLAGPGAAVLVLMAVLAGLYKLDRELRRCPLCRQLGKRHLDQIDVMISVPSVKRARPSPRPSPRSTGGLARLEGQTDAGAFVPNPGALSPDRGV
jgi:hypothetical protein